MSSLIHGLVRVAGLLAALALWAGAATRGLSEHSGALTLADLERSLIQAVPGWLEAGFAAPWWAFALAAALPSLFLVWPFGRGAPDDDAEPAGADEDLPRWRAAAIQAPIPVALVDPVPGLSGYDPVTPAAVPDTMISAFRAVAARSAMYDGSEALRAHTEADRAWSRVRDILVARPDADRDGVWSVGDAPPDPAEDRDWSAPEGLRGDEDDPLPAFAAGYRGDVILEAEDGVEHHCRLAIVPAKNCSAEMAEAIGRAIEAFVAARTRADRFEPDRQG